MLGRSLFEVFPNANPITIRKYNEVAVSGQPAHFEVFSLAVKDKHIDVYAFSPEKGKVAVIFRDITKRKQLEEQTRIRAEELATVMETTPVVIWIGHDPKSHSITGNRLANELYDAEVGENVSANVTSVRRFFHEGRELTADELPMQEAALNDIDIRNVELDVLLPSGKQRVILGSASPLHDANGHVRGSVGAFIDITERKRMEEALQESETRYRMLFDKSMDAIILSDPRGVGIILSANPAACKLLGWTEEELILKGLDVIFDVKNPAISTLLDENISSGSAKSQINYRRKDGTIFTGEISSTFFIDRNGEPRAVSILRDVTERKQIEDALRMSEQHLNDLLSSIKDGFFELDHEWRFTYINQCAANNVGFEPEELIGEYVWEKAPFIVRSKYEKMFREVMKNRLPTSTSIPN
jgi:PAS domain S-box-containing protein